MIYILNEYLDTLDKKKKSVVAEQAGEIYLHGMQGIVFGHYLDELLKGVPYSERSVQFMDAMWETLDDALAQAVETTGDDITSMKRQNTVRAKVRKDYMALRKELRIE